MLREIQLIKIENIIRQELIDKGVSCVILIDDAGNIIANLDDGKYQQDILSLACLSAGNYGVITAMANLLGEEDFSLLFHKGNTKNLHFKSITSEYLLISIFDKELSLGFLRLKVADAVEKIRENLGLFIELQY
jgi:predicted regulator of Ras-like GTPase activity (Roadblock/LC7/MglB family)